MGDIINLEKNAEMEEERSIKFSLVSPIDIEKIEIIRNNDPLISYTPESETFNAVHVDKELFNDIALDHSQEPEKFVFYYLRIHLQGNNMAWSSPIWIIKPQMT